jgi:signal transduction histidine kinase
LTPSDGAGSSKGPALKISTICIATGLAGLASLAIAIGFTPHAWRDPVMFGFFVIALCALHSVPLRLTHEGDLEGMQLEEALFVPMALLLSPAETLVALVVSEAFGHAWRRRGGMKAMFNIGQIVTCAAIGLGISRAFGAETGRFGSLSIGGAVIGGLVFPALTAVAVAGIISVAQGARFRTVLSDGGATRVAMWVGSISLGVVVVLATAQARWAAALVIIPVVVVQLAYAGARTQWRERQRIEALYEAASAIRSSIDPAQVRANLVAQAKRQLEAIDAEIVAAGALEDAETAYAELGDDAAVAVTRRVGGGGWDAGDRAMLRALAGVAAGALQNAELFEEVGNERQKLSDVLSSTSDGILTVDADNRVVSWNPAMERITGHTSADVCGRLPIDVLCPASPAEIDATTGTASAHHAGADDESDEALVADPFAAGGSEPRLLRIRAASGSERWLTVTRSPLPDGGAVIVARDETAKKEVDDLKADFLATISHELRTPLTPIKGYLTMLLGDQPLEPERIRSFLEVMARQTGRLERLIGDLLDATSLQQNQLYLPDEVDWAVAVRDVASLVRNQFPDHEIALELPSELPRLMADEQRAEQILGNLMSNACKYSPLNSTVTVSVRVDDDQIRTTVSDQGPGVPLADRSRIFERFTRLGDHMRRTVGGAGLGLFIARQLVDAMGGSIKVEDAPGGGAAFSFTLPISNTSAPTNMAASTANMTVHAAM